MGLGKKWRNKELKTIKEEPKLEQTVVKSICLFKLFSLETAAVPANENKEQPFKAKEKEAPFIQPKEEEKKISKISIAVDGEGKMENVSLRNVEKTKREVLA